jgi:hypothetical protein
MKRTIRFSMYAVTIFVFMMMNWQKPCVNYNQHNRSAAQKNPVNKICLLLVFSVPTERAAIATGNDLRGLGICHQQALAGIPETGFLLNTQSYVRLHCLPVVLRVFGRGSVYSCRIDKPLITAYNRIVILSCYNRKMQKIKIFRPL